MEGDRRAQHALVVLLGVIFGGAVLIALSEPLVAKHHGLSVALFSALPLVAIRCAIPVLESDDD